MQRKGVRNVHVFPYRGMHLRRVVALAVLPPLRDEHAGEDFHEAPAPAPGEALEVYVLRSRNFTEVPDGYEAEAAALVEFSNLQFVARLVLQERRGPHAARVVRHGHVQNLVLRPPGQHRQYARLQRLRGAPPVILYQVEYAQVAPEGEG